MATKAKNKSKYQRYLASREWSLKREAVRERSKNRCEHCYMAPQQAVHHMTYEHLYNEPLRDLLAVCHPCHEWLSGLSEVNPLKEYYSVSVPLVAPSLARMGYGTPYHYLVPNNLPDGEAVLLVREHPCMGDGCLWCGYIDEDWMLYISDLAMSWSMRAYR